MLAHRHAPSGLPSRFDIDLRIVASPFDHAWRSSPGSPHCTCHACRDGPASDSPCLAVAQPDVWPEPGGHARPHRCRRRHRGPAVLGAGFARQLRSGFRTGEPKWVIGSTVLLAGAVFVALNGPVGDPERIAGTVLECSSVSERHRPGAVVSCVVLLDDGTRESVRVTRDLEFGHRVHFLRYERRIVGTAVVRSMEAYAPRALPRELVETSPGGILQ